MIAQHFICVTNELLIKMLNSVVMALECPRHQHKENAIYNFVNIRAYLNVLFVAQINTNDSPTFLFEIHYYSIYVYGCI